MSCVFLRNKIIAAVSVIIFLFLFIFINPREFITDLIHFNPFIIVILVSIFVFDLFLRVIRWWILLRSQEANHLPFKALISPSFSSSLLNLFVPGRLGELVRLYALRDQYNIRYSVGLSIIVVEQVINVLGLVLVGSLGLALILISGIELNSVFLNQIVPYAFFASLLVIAGLILLFVVEPTKFIPLFRILPEKLFLKVEQLIKTFSFGLHIIKGKFYIFWVAFLSSISIWILEGVMIWLVTIEFFSSPNFEFPVALFSSVLGNLNFMFPILPGAALQYEAFIAYILSVSPHYIGAKAVSVALFDRLLKTVILLIVGGYSTVTIGFGKINEWKNSPPVTSNDQK